LHPHQRGKAGIHRLAATALTLGKQHPKRPATTHHGAAASQELHEATARSSQRPAPHSSADAANSTSHPTIGVLGGPEASPARHRLHRSALAHRSTFS
jgi:hypothetical protein